MKSLAATILLISTSATAWPVDVLVEVKAGEEKFQKAAGVEWVDVKDPSVAAVEVLPGDEVLITPKRGPETLVLLYGEGRMGVWSLSVDTCNEAGTRIDGGTYIPPAIDCSMGKGVGVDLAPVMRTCPGAKRNTASRTDALVVHVATDPCRFALRELFKTNAHHSREITLTFEIGMLQSQLRDIQAGIDSAIGAKKVETAYAGASLRLKGSITQAEHKKVLWAVFNSAVGRVSLDDRLIITDKPAPDAGTLKSP
jgi:hypothetical protein